MAPTRSAAYLAASGWLYDRIDYERLGKSGANYRFTLDRMRELVLRLGHGRCLAPNSSAAQGSLANADCDPGHGGPVGGGKAPRQPRPRIVHIAGTKGKGSVASMVASLLTASGAKVGLYTSPHLVDLSERFRVDGQPATPGELVALIESFKPIVDAMSSEPVGGPSFFELTTAIAIEHFHRSGCDYWVMETGLGGRLDSTNVFQSDVTVITSIGLDHQHVLGDTVEKIAKEKAGIFKPGVPAISGVTRESVKEVIRQQAREVGCELAELERDFQVQTISAIPWGSHFAWAPCADRGRASAEEAVAEEANMPEASATEANLKEVSAQGASGGPFGAIEVRLAVEGQHQVRNAALAIAAVRELEVPVTPRMIDRLSVLRIDARLERFVANSGAAVVLDAAHNPDSIAALLDTLQRRCAGRRIVGVFGTSVDKDAAAMLGQLKQSFTRVVFTRYHQNPRFVSTGELADAAGEELRDVWFSIQEEPLEACRQAICEAGPDGVVVICGSFFLAAEVRPWLVKAVDFQSSSAEPVATKP
ncbi:dihydrofolate synthase / folylpolyglutamate synthase [Neorhodopirellula lusitana]|uniref:Dihydrofolate synthase/folylpolyglutamate synthase n=1 Tax=Neorhodopirellula lusitana TaxID=445327 RepID=A0ABY1PW59_9BACT|nr:folylpolyglutamate synthase/dihydrofolate synthase family protein [Neorhodopirellula lusitana]SMP50597.1 dihydrofolate synthase / folylpolyglutamate synthase [Neorhodopirellula lusitana]